jgi:DNA-binding transcriptional regulator YdaS (Cro superfamily)
MDKLITFIDSYGGSTLAARLGVSKSTVSSWRHGRFRVPAERCREIERVAGGAVTVHDMRPDVFGPAPTERSAA